MASCVNSHIYVAFGAYVVETEGLSSPSAEQGGMHGRAGGQSKSDPQGCLTSHWPGQTAAVVVPCWLVSYRSPPTLCPGIFFSKPPDLNQRMGDK